MRTALSGWSCTLTSGLKLRLARDGAPRLGVGPSSLAGFGTAFALLRDGGGDAQESITEPPDLEGWALGGAGLGELPGWPGLVSLQARGGAPGQGRYEVTSIPQRAACAAGCLVLSAPPVASWGLLS